LEAERNKTTETMTMVSKEPPVGERRGIIDVYTQAKTAHDVGLKWAGEATVGRVHRRSVDVV
jgi:hypothetical protein